MKCGTDSSSSCGGLRELVQPLALGPVHSGSFSRSRADVGLGLLLPLCMQRKCVCVVVVVVSCSGADTSSCVRVEEQVASLGSTCGDVS